MIWGKEEYLKSGKTLSWANVFWVEKKIFMFFWKITGKTN
jgi:hypothetical protein